MYFNHLFITTIGKMISFAIFFVFLGLCNASEIRVVNGTDAEEGEFPYIVSFRYNAKHSCGASILNEYFILTAAHCVNGRIAQNMSIQYGILEISNDDYKAIDVDFFVIHEEYLPEENFNDIAIVKLLSPIPLSENVFPITLPPSGIEYEHGTDAVLVGWGLPYTNGSVMIHLQKVDLIVYSFENCQKAHGDEVNEIYNLCGGVEEGGKGQCSGDSGGPLTVKEVIVGIVSWSVKPCTIVGYPGVYVRVASYVEWIEETLELYS